MNIFTEIKQELEHFVKIAREAGKYNEMLLKYNNINSPYYDQVKIDLIQDKINEIENEYIKLYSKYFYN